MQRSNSQTKATAKFHRAPARYLTHQQGVAGTLTIRLVEARSLDAGAGWWSSQCNAYTVFSLGPYEVRSSTATSNANPTWRRELLELPIAKLDDSTKMLDDPVNVNLEIDMFTKGSVVQNAGGIRDDHRIGSAELDVTELIDGRAEVMDQWVCLKDKLSNGEGLTKKKTKVCGEVHIMLQYEPRGIEPIIGDIVKLEGFGSLPLCVFPSISNLLLMVTKVNGNFLLCADVNDPDVAYRLHRYCVFVVERTTLLDEILRKAMMPIEYAQKTKIGIMVCEAARPYVALAIAVSSPAVMAAKATCYAAFRASLAAVGSITDQ